MTEYQQGAPPNDGGGRHDAGGSGGPGGGQDGPGGSAGGPGGGAGGGGTPAGSYSQAHGEGVGTGGNDQKHVQVLDQGRAEDLRNRWNQVQSAFVDQPQQAVNDADQLVGEVLDEVSRVFREQRAELEKGWSTHEEPGTEDMRQALFRYREFFDRLLSL